MTDVSRAADRLVHDHIKAVYEFAHDLFPGRDPDWFVDTVFTRAACEPPAAGDAEVWHLFRFVLEAAPHAPAAPPWESVTSARGRRPISHRRLVADAVVAAEARRLVDAHDRLSWNERVVLRLITVVRGVPQAAYPVILGVTNDEAERTLHEVRERFRDAYDQLQPSEPPRPDAQRALVN